MRKKARIVLHPGTDRERVFSFVEQITIGRRGGRDTPFSARAVIQHGSVSGRHCVVTQDSGSRFYVCDESRNGTRLDGRRLVPNVRTPVEPGQRLRLPGDHVLELRVEDDVATNWAAFESSVGVTAASEQPENEVTILHGDIAGYTALNQELSARQVLPAVEAVLGRVSEIIEEYLGTIWEYEGDALFAFWERDNARPGWHVRSACQAALELEDVVAWLARDTRVWSIPSHPLRMDWAVTTGTVTVGTVGVESRGGLQLRGEPVERVKRLEKLVEQSTGGPLVDAATVDQAGSAFRFRKLERAESDPVYVLLESADDATQEIF